MFIFLLIVVVFPVPTQQQGFVPLVAQNFNERVNSALQQQVISYVSQEIAYKHYASYFDRADVDLPGFEHFFSTLAKEAVGNAKNLTDFINQRGGRIRYPVISLKETCDYIRQELSLGLITKPVNSQSVTIAARQDPLICRFQLLNPEPSIKKKHSKEYSWLSYIKFKKPVKEEKEEKFDRDTWLNGLYGLEDALAMERITSSSIKKTLDLATDLRDPLTRHRLEEYLSAQIENIYRSAGLVTRLQQHQSLDSYILEEYLLDSELQS